MHSEACLRPRTAFGGFPSAFGGFPSAFESLRKAFVGLRGSFFWSQGCPRSENGGLECSKTMKKHRKNNDFVKFSKIGSETLSEVSGSGPDVFPEPSGTL